MRLNVVPMAVAVLVMPLLCPSPAGAYEEGLPLDGTFVATSNGDWAKTNDVYHDEVTVRQVWRITTACENPQSCRGRLISDAGWTSDIAWRGDRWHVVHDVPNWQTCPDGTTSPGRQTFWFYPVDVETGRVRVGSPVFAGEDSTVGLSGACGSGAPMRIRLPLRVEKMS